MDGFQKILLLLIPVTLLVWILIGVSIIRQKIHFHFDHSTRLRRGLRRAVSELNLGKTGSAGAAGNAGAAGSASAD
ncbi:MAG: hypothetical protein HYU99_01245 [Deltaproteobacteria bacterium]|nr:hypothetical protein [Deltaproteobacteria bacterium]